MATPCKRELDITLNKGAGKEQLAGTTAHAILTLMKPKLLQIRSTKRRCALCGIRSRLAFFCRWT